MSAHTPGPWSIEDNSICNEEFDICIAVIEDDGGYEATPVAQDANAFLIAAAPDLLAACKAVSKGVGKFSTNDLTRLQFREVWKLCTAAIEKSEGRSE